MKIAILGWGSLIWDKRPEFDDGHDGWLLDGPSLRLEFSRVSKSRAGALTLVVDEQHGEICRVAYAVSKRKNLDDALCDLRCREGTVLQRIGYYFADGSRSGKPGVPDGIKTWAAGQNLDVIVWTGLLSNFQDKHRQPFSIPEALSYLRNLSPEGKAKAAEYVWRAPEFVQTPLRSALEVEPWFAPKSGESLLKDKSPI